jgi:hypothetical protein
MLLQVDIAEEHELSVRQVEETLVFFVAYRSEIEYHTACEVSLADQENG